MTDQESRPGTGDRPVTDAKSPIGAIVSSAHLAETSSVPALSEVEFALILSSHAFSRWIVRGMGAVGHGGLAPLEVLVLNAAYHRERDKTLADLCLMLNVEDTHTVSYALRTLESRGLVKAGRRGKEKTVAITEEGARACEDYAEVREACLGRHVKALGLDPQALSDAAALLRMLSGQYDQAARAATSL